jgi:hypothetical protein
MTETQAIQQIQQPVVTIGQAVGQAEAVLSKILAQVLAETGTSRQHYLAMQRLTALGGTASREDYVADLASWLGLDLWGAGELADALSAAGLLEPGGGGVGLSAAGEELRGRIAGAAGAVTRPLLASLDPGDIATTIATLATITARAREILAAGAGEAA